MHLLCVCACACTYACVCAHAWRPALTASTCTHRWDGGASIAQTHASMCACVHVRMHTCCSGRDDRGLKARPAGGRGVGVSGGATHGEGKTVVRSRCLGVRRHPFCPPAPPLELLCLFVEVLGHHPHAQTHLPHEERGDQVPVGVPAIALACVIIGSLGCVRRRSGALALQTCAIARVKKALRTCAAPTLAAYAGLGPRPSGGSGMPSSPKPREPVSFFVFVNNGQSQGTTGSGGAMG